MGHYLASLYAAMREREEERTEIQQARQRLINPETETMTEAIERTQPLRGTTAAHAAVDYVPGVKDRYGDPRPEPETTADQLAKAWIDAKHDEEFANARRLRIEEQIVALFGAKEEGAQTHDLPSGLKVEIKGALKYTADMKALEPLLLQLPEALRPVKTETKVDETGAKYLRLNEPEAWRLIAPAFTVKPAKTSVRVKV